MKTDNYVVVCTLYWTIDKNIGGLLSFIANCEDALAEAQRAKSSEATGCGNTLQEEAGQVDAQ